MHAQHQPLKLVCSIKGKWCQIWIVATVVFLKVRLRRRSQEHKRRIISIVSPHLCWKNDECSNNCAPKKRRHSIKNDEMSNNCSRLSPSAVHRLSHQLCAMADRATAATAERSAPHPLKYTLLVKVLHLDELHRQTTTVEL